MPPVSFIHDAGVEPARCATKDRRASALRGWRAGLADPGQRPRIPKLG